MTHIATFFSDSDYDDYPFDDPDYVIAYHELARVLHSKGAKLSLVRHMSTYLGENEFDGGWTFDGSTFKRTEELLVPGVIYNKGKTFYPTAYANVVNGPVFQSFCADKLKVYCMFPSISPLSFYVDCRDDLDAVEPFIPGDKVIIKPLGGFGGKGITIADKGDIPGDDVFAPSVVQEFIDMSAGIPGIASGAHDFRIIVANGDVLLTFVRLPKDEKGYVNEAQLGSLVIVPEELRPEGAMALVPIVERVFSRFPNRMYAIDCARGADGSWKLIEINEQPGLMTTKECGEFATKYYDQLSDFLIEAARANTEELECIEKATVLR